MPHTRYAYIEYSQLEDGGVKYDVHPYDERLGDVSFILMPDHILKCSDYNLPGRKVQQYDIDSVCENKRRFLDLITGVDIHLERDGDGVLKGRTNVRNGVVRPLVELTTRPNLSMAWCVAVASDERVVKLGVSNFLGLFGV